MTKQELEFCEKYESAVHSKYWLSIMPLTEKGQKELSAIKEFIEKNKTEYLTIQGEYEK